LNPAENRYNFANFFVCEQHMNVVYIQRDEMMISKRKYLKPSYHVCFFFFIPYTKILITNASINFDYVYSLSVINILLEGR